MKPAIIVGVVLLLSWLLGFPLASADPLAGFHSKVQVQPVIPLKAHAFPLQDVRLLDGPFKHAMELNRQYLLSLDVDRLLHSFRVNAGLPSTATPYGGWEEPKSELRGHFVGHYLTACALMYASTGDERLKEKGSAVVTGLAACQAKIGTGYLSAFPEEFFDRVEKQQRVWAPYYTLHKLYAGLLDMYVHCDNQQALELCKKFADWAVARNARLTEYQMQAMLGNEHGGMNEVLANLYALTGEAKYLNTARRFNHLAVIGPAAKREDRLTGLHANTQIPKFVGTARQFELTGEEWLRTASTFFWNTVVHERSYVIGGHSDGEMFSPKEKLSEALGPNTTETCNTYNMLKLTRHLFCWDPRAEYFDYYERALYNHILASQNPETGMMCYYVPLRSGSKKTYNTPEHSFWCCTGTGIENHAKYGDSIYFHDGNDTLYVNLFIASELTGPNREFVLRQETRFPEEDTTRLTLKCDHPIEGALKIRYPAWAAAGVSVTLNGINQGVQAAPGSFLTLRRQWRNGDRVEVRFPFRLSTEGFRDNPRRLAFLHGPLVLCARVDTRKPFPAIMADADQVLAGLTPVAGKPSTFTGSPDLFHIAGERNPGVTLEAFYQMHGDQHYVVYWDLFTPAQWQMKQAEYQAELARQKELEARTVDFVWPGNEQNERDHRLRGDKTASGDFSDRKWRHATDGGWFSWEVKVRPDTPQQLWVTYWGSDGGNRVFDILVDGEKIATQRLQNNRPDQFYEEVYPLPEKLTRGKRKITVTFQAHPGEWAGGVFGVRVMAPAETAPPAATAPSPAAPGSDYPILPVSFTAVQVTDGFWSPRLATNRAVTIPYAFKKCEETGRIDNFAVAGKLKDGKFRGIHFNDSDVFKVIEGAAYALAIQTDPELGSYVDGVIDQIAAAQEPDGYLYTARTLCGPDYMPPGGKERWSDMGGGHELYNVGHLYEAAVAYFQATGKRKLLDVALKNADLVCNVFGPGKKTSPCGHQEIEIGLVKLYRITGDEKYLRQAKFFLDMRGRPLGRALYGEYAQDHQPVTEQIEAVGHAVRAAYMYSGMADVAALTGDAAYLAAIDRLWENVVSKKLYVTGGIGARGGGEAFGEEYELPNRTAYCETCAAIANALWNHRMFLLHGDARYVDVLERVIYNGFLSGISMKGERFFYPNPLESHRGGERSPWFDCACCPANVCRFVPSIPGYAYAHRDDRLYVNLYIGGTAHVTLAGQNVQIRQETRYPWDGRVRLTLTPQRAARFTVAVRLPGWAQNLPVPSDLYRFADPAGLPPTLRVNSKLVNPQIEKGYAILTREWKPGDTLELELPMPVRRVLAHDKVEDDRGRVAFQRGPLIYCAEGPDNKDGRVLNLMVPDATAMRTEFREDLLQGVVTLTGRAQVVARDATGTPRAAGEQEIVLIPYYAWAHRQPGQMAVWLAREVGAARPLPGPTLAFTSKVRVSGGTGLEALNDQLEPRSSVDHSNPFFHWWPRKGTQEWVEYHFPQPARVSRVEVYWFDDTGIGECRLPKSWRLLTRVGGVWNEVSNPSRYGVAKDQYNRCDFEAVEAEALRLEVQLPEHFSAGIHEWRVE